MKANRQFTNPFSDLFLQTWQLWKDFRKEEHGFSYKGVISEQMAINRLVTVSEGDEEKAKRIVEQSISRGWMDFYQLKQHNPNGKSAKSTSKNRPDSSSIEDDAANVLIRRNAERGQQDDWSNLKAV